MEDGAFGIATALIYPPGCYAGTDELVALCDVVARTAAFTSRIYAPRNRDSWRAWRRRSRSRAALASPLRFTISRRPGPPNWGKMAEVIRRIDAARAEGIDITADMYPYDRRRHRPCLVPPSLGAKRTAGSGRTCAIPRRGHGSGEAMIAPATDWENLGASAGPDGVILAGLRRPEHRAYLGRESGGRRGRATARMGRLRARPARPPKARTSSASTSR